MGNPNYTLEFRIAVVNYYLSGQGNDATVELSPVAGLNVLGIRDGIISDQTALRTLQEYIRTQCLR